MSKQEPGFFSAENARTLFILIILILCFRWSIASPYHVPTPSMEPTIKVGDRLLAFKLSYDLKIPFTDITIFKWSNPKRGDIVVFRYPKDPEIDYVKRVIGIAGDRLRFQDDILYVNGTQQSRVESSDRSILSDIEEPENIKQLFQENLDGIKHWVMQNEPGKRGLSNSNWPIQGEFHVPEGAIFVSGDNRDSSSDSRTWGTVPMEYIRGKAIFVIWSMYLPPESNFPKIRLNRFGHTLI
ncbi:MAG: signal peptidase I [Zetaproteobacteria bacterium]|nr:signal peptidase I [Pseudobdellovibrionaceae bacterium]